MSAWMFFGETLDSTKTALMRRSLRKVTNSLIAPTPASLSVLMPWMPRT
jgi:hypothetical protein